MGTNHNETGRRQVVKVAQEIPPRVLKLRDGARYIGKSLWKFKNMIWAGEIPVIRGDHDTSPWTVDIRDLDSWIEREKGFANV